jgi:hypothetical protein
MNYIKIAKAYAKAGYSVIPVNSNKIPSIKQWKEYQNKSMDEKECELYFDNVYGMALLCGGKNKVTAIDFDLKYDLSGDLFERFKEKLGKEILQKMYVQSTKNGGYHLVFSCNKVEGNQKLASRYTTCYEQHQTYMDNYNQIATRDKAIKIATNDRTRVLIETRGEGGYICINPTPNYTKVYGKLQEISEAEYEVIMNTAREFNEIAEVKKDIRTSKYDEWKLSPFKDYNERGDVLHLLAVNGWDQVGRQHGRSVRLKRPGQTHAKSSALFDTETHVFNVFSTSTVFDINKGYTPSDIFIELECNGDVTEAFKKLVALNYGEK